MPVTLEKMMKGVSPARRRQIETAAAEIVRANRLSLLRESVHLTQADVALALGTSQANLSQFEQKTDVKLSTLRGYVEALGGVLEVVAKMPGQRPIVLSFGDAFADAKVKQIAKSTREANVTAKRKRAAKASGEG